MADYIEREAAIKLIAEDKVEITPLLCAITQAYTAEQAFDGLNQSCDRHIKFISSIPSADVQPVKHGQWFQDAVYVDETTGEPCLAWFCNQCGEPQMVGTNYCPNCGARMDGET